MTGDGVLDDLVLRDDGVLIDGDGTGQQRCALHFLRSGVVLFIIVMLALLVRVLWLGKESLWWDEAYSVAVAGTGGWRDLAGRLWHADANMSLYYALLHVWISLGRTEFVIRALSVVFAVLTIPVVYLLGCRLLGRRTGMLASLLLALNVYHIQYAQEARSYALLVLLVTLASLFFVSAIRRPSWKSWAFYTGTIVLAVYSHLFAAFVLVAHWSSLGVLRRRDVPWRFVGLSICAVAVLLLPLVVFVLTNGTSQIDWVPRPGPDAVLRSFSFLAGAAPVSEIHAGGMLFVASGVARRLLLLVYAGCFGAAVVGGARFWSRTRMSPETWAYAFLLLWLLVPVILAYLVSLVKPIFVFYYLIVSLPPLVILAANGLSRIQPPVGRVAALLILACLALVQLSAYYHVPRKEDWRGATEYIVARAQPGDALVFVTGSREAFTYYRDGERNATSTAPRILSLSTVLRDPPRRVWLVLAHATDPQTVAIRSRLAVGYVIVDDERFFHGIRLLLYQTRAGR